MAARGAQKRVAQERGVHPSTVSRAVKNGKAADQSAIGRASNDIRTEQFIRETLRK